VRKSVKVFDGWNIFFFCITFPLFHQTSSSAMQKSNLPLFFVLLCFAFSCNKNSDPNGLSVRSESFDFSPASCDPEEIAGTPLHEKHLRFSRLLAIALGQSVRLREALQSISTASSQEYFDEIFVQDFLIREIESTTVDARLSQIFQNIPSLAKGQTFSTFKSELLSADPLLVIKIPDWFADTTWNVQTTAPHVISNMKGQGQLLYGFKGDGDCFSKVSFFEFTNYEIVVKTSEDYLWIEGPEFLDGFANPCMSYQDFFDEYARAYAGHYLLKKRDMQQLFMSCQTAGPEGTSGGANCLRDEGFDHNYMKGFQLGNPNIILTLSNQPCLGGEETFDFQVDFLYAFRTAEAAAIDAKLPPLTYYGLRLSDLVETTNIVVGTALWGIPIYKVEMVPKYYSFGIGSIKYDYMKHINPEDGEWVRALMGGALFVTWHETDFEICTSTGVTTVTNTSAATFNYALLFQWLPGATSTTTFNSSYSKVSSHTVSVTGAATIPLGFNALGYCDPPTPWLPNFSYPTGVGPGGLYVHYNYHVD
jgi:hypothetical protein